jgi:hypothetical protein
MEKVLHYYEHACQTPCFARNIQHTLLLHANLLNAHYIGKLAQVYTRNGYAFITLCRKPCRIKLYETDLLPGLASGEFPGSTAGRLSQGKGNDFFKGEPAMCLDYINEMTK